MSAIEQIEWETCLIEPGRNRELEKHMRREMGVRSPVTLYFAECPWIPRSVAAFNFLRGKLVAAELDLAEKISLVVSQDNSCRFCFAAQRLLMRIVGMPEERIRRLEQDLLTADVEPAERAALEFARRLSRSNPLLTGTDLKSLRDVGYSEGAIKEIAVVVAYSCAVNRFTTFPALPPQRWEQLPDRWAMRVLRPLLGRFIESRRSRGKPDFLEPALRTGPFSDVVLALDGLPLARSLRQVVDEAWSSPILTRRAKALVIAVVARGLGCTVSEREAARLLMEEGLGAEDLQEILAHLASPKLDAVEAVLVPFARETVWYRPVLIQRRARTVSEQLSGPQFLEALGIVALANMLCRLGILVQDV
jgi:alkylhydroperoxidase family enzyme